MLFLLRRYVLVYKTFENMINFRGTYKCKKFFKGFNIFKDGYITTLPWLNNLNNIPHFLKTNATLRNI